jgi:hypothetical protein
VLTMGMTNETVAQVILAYYSSDNLICHTSS